MLTHTIYIQRLKSKVCLGDIYIYIYMWSGEMRRDRKELQLKKDYWNGKIT